MVNKFFVITFLFFSFSIQSKEFDFSSLVYSPEKTLQQVNAKERVLVKECSVKVKHLNFDTFEISYAPKRDNSSSIHSFSSDMAISTWNKKYENSDVVVIFSIDIKNRFGEISRKEKKCGWSGFNYDMVYFSE